MRAVSVVAVLMLVAGAAAADAPYAVSKTWALGGEGGWDYATLDASGARLYIPRQSHTQVIDTASGKVVLDVTGNAGAHGVALVPELDRGFISNGKDGTVQVFDLKSGAELGRLAAAEDADGIIYDPGTKHVLVMCGDAQKLLTFAADVDPKTGKADGTIELGGKPEFSAADGAGKVYVNLVDKDLVAVVDIKEKKVLAKWSTAPGTGPVGMSMDPATHRLFVGCRNEKLLVMDADKDGKVLGSVAIGHGVDATAVAGKLIFASCGDGTLTVAQEDPASGLKVVETVKTATRARTMAVDAKTGTVYLPTADVEGKGPRPKPVPGTFKVLVVSRAAH